jgi:preprotein translocase subunit SecG
MTVSLFSFGKVIGSKLDEKLFNNKKPKKFLKVTIFILLYILIILMFAILLTLITLEHKLLYKDVKMEVN